MVSKVEQIEEQLEVKRYKVQYPISAYISPSEARIHQVHFDDEYMHMELTDGRMLSVPHIPVFGTLERFAEMQMGFLCKS
jgi:hypothetical protein